MSLSKISAIAAYMATTEGFIELKLLFTLMNG